MIGLKKISKYRIAYKNWISVIWNIVRGYDNIRVKLKNAEVIKLTQDLIPWFSIQVTMIGLDRALSIITGPKAIDINNEEV
ncbi:MAG: hypothetical protein M1290_01905 [Candidatus Thermoplasmatota archaeon]|jgi:hypothetical protein|nr:hypothetical protein [Candidatus Thermoplasmatota archaeon]MCL5789203.1 hypothetical protein [Candidatus Thermoplasmatota archaeon]